LVAAGHYDIPVSPRFPGVCQLTQSIIGYGEDALTYWALSLHLKQLLTALQANCRPRECLVFYRPSFGRGTNIGEFDAILATPDCIYLVECKWQSRRPPKSPVAAITLNKTQLRRHRLWKRIWEMWLQNGATIFGEPPLRIEKEDFTLPNAGKTLAQNLTFVFQQIDRKVGKVSSVRDVCLYFFPAGSSEISDTQQAMLPKRILDEAKVEQDFELVRFSYPPHQNTAGFIETSVPTPANNSDTPFVG
jgi:hypothetical protein